MSEPRKSSLDPAKIKGPYPLLAAVLVAIEGLLGIWLYRAEGAVERIAAGVLMTAIILAVVAAAIRIASRSTLRAPGLSKPITAAQTEVTTDQINSPSPEAMAGPDGSYLINRPPPDWTIEDLSWGEWIRRNIGIKDEAKEKDPSPTGIDSIVRVLRSPRMVHAIPIPGKTKVDGVLYPTALEVRMQTMLTISVISRAQPPLYNERPLSHNFFRELNGLTASGLLTLRALSSGTILGTGRKYQKAEFLQRVEDAVVGGLEGQSVDLNLTVIGIESDLWDYMLMMHYPSPQSTQPAINADIEALLAVVNSFQPLKLFNSEKKRAELRQEADKKLREFIAAKGEGLFYAEIGIAFLIIKQLRLQDPVQRLRAIELLRPFEAFAKEIGLVNEEVAKLFGSLHEAETGNATDFIATVGQTIKAIEAKSEETPQAPAALPAADVNPPALP